MRLIIERVTVNILGSMVGLTSKLNSIGVVGDKFAEWFNMHLVFAVFRIIGWSRGYHSVQEVLNAAEKLRKEGAI